MDETNTVVPVPEIVTLESAEHVIDFWQQRAEAAEAEASAACQEWDVKCQELEQQLMEIAEVLTATNVVSDFDDPVKLAHGIAEYCAGHHPGAAIRAWRGDGDGDGREEQEGESDGNA